MIDLAAKDPTQLGRAIPCPAAAVASALIHSISDVRECPRSGATPDAFSSSDSSMSDERALGGASDALENPDPSLSERRTPDARWSS